MKQGIILQEVKDTLLEMYDVDPEALGKDFFDFVEKRNKSGLVKIG